MQANLTSVFVLCFMGYKARKNSGHHTNQTSVSWHFVWTLSQSSTPLLSTWMLSPGLIYLLVKNICILYSKTFTLTFPMERIYFIYHFKLYLWELDFYAIKFLGLYLSSKQSHGFLQVINPYLSSHVFYLGVLESCWCRLWEQHIILKGHEE